MLTPQFLHKSLYQFNTFYKLFFIFYSTKKDCKGKMKGGSGWNLRMSGFERYHKTSILHNFSRIFEESVTGNDSRETPRKFFIESHHG